MPNKHNYQTICQKVAACLSDRQKQIIQRRFGLAGNEKETLQKIGNDFEITRERVRQITQEALTKLRDQQKSRDLSDALIHFKNYLRRSGGVRRQDVMLVDLGGEELANSVDFLLALSDSFYHFPETEKVFGFWALEQDVFENKIKNILEKVSKRLEKSRKQLSAEALLTLVQDQDKPSLLFSVLELAKDIEQGPLGGYGLIDWPEIKPRGVRDAAFIALCDCKAPLHFRKIAERANDLTSECLGGRQVLPQTVHNELIRDERFVLVGRGVYGLKEWGYQPGTVKEVIARVLQTAERPLTREQILEQVQEQRLVKANTIFLNLSDKDLFVRNSQGEYSLI